MVLLSGGIHASCYLRIQVLYSYESHQCRSHEELLLGYVVSYTRLLCPPQLSASLFAPHPTIQFLIFDSFLCKLYPSFDVFRSRV